jgi:hypothetical protein
MILPFEIRFSLASDREAHSCLEKIAGYLEDISSRPVTHSKNSDFEWHAEFSFRDIEYQLSVRWAEEKDRKEFLAWTRERCRSMLFFTKFEYVSPPQELADCLVRILRKVSEIENPRWVDPNFDHEVVLTSDSEV